ncbi:FRG domain-containing protein [Sphingobium baderi]|uniref:FRG domain-containing protein n=1 Tax=Sphingobium baderi TaxID=1332080 RepID=UPI002B40246E|nr:FRG domain-containing protein [Sphingobium baderi]WRD75834.1 FRG domain-containing protein [Sphingobium baderi]
MARAASKTILKKPSSAKPKVSASPTVAGSPTTLSDFIGLMTKYAQSSSTFKCYRGQRDAGWPNVPALLRTDLSDLEQNEKRAVRDLISVHPNEFAADGSMFDKLVRMQHFGLPTRLMDVSRNPLVALYFATDPGDPRDPPTDGAVTGFAVPEGREKYFDSDSVSCLANLANMTTREKEEIVAVRRARLSGTTKEAEITRINGEDVIKRLHQFIRVEKPHFLPIIDPIDLFKPYFVHPKMSNRRILSQAGGFIIHGLEPPKKINFAHTIVETKFVIPMGAKEKLREALDLLGINDSTLFPELDRAAKRIKERYTSTA